MGVVAWVGVEGLVIVAKRNRETAASSFMMLKRSEQSSHAHPIKSCIIPSFTPAPRTAADDNHLKANKADNKHVLFVLCTSEVALVAQRLSNILHHGEHETDALSSRPAGLVQNCRGQEREQPRSPRQPEPPNRASKGIVYIVSSPHVRY